MERLTCKAANSPCRSEKMKTSNLVSMFWATTFLRKMINFSCMLKKSTLKIHPGSQKRLKTVLSEETEIVFVKTNWWAYSLVKKLFFICYRVLSKKYPFFLTIIFSWILWWNKQQSPSDFLFCGILSCVTNRKNWHNTRKNFSIKRLT